MTAARRRYFQRQAQMINTRWTVANLDAPNGQVYSAEPWIASAPVPAGLVVTMGNLAGLGDRTFATHAEAVAYADRMARDNADPNVR